MKDDVPVLMLHGLLGCKDDWHEVATSLQTGRRLAVFDLPGHGPAADASEDSDCSMDAACHRIEAVLEALEAPRGHLVGYSLGARTALYFAATRPGCVASLVLESGTPGLEDEAERALRRSEDEERATALTRDGLEAFVGVFENYPIFASERKLAPEVLAAQRRRRLGGDAGALARSLRHSGSGTVHWLGEHLSKIDVPVLLIAGGLDERYAADARAMKEKIPNATLEIVPGAGHNVHLEKPEIYIDLVDTFLGSQASQASRANQGGRTLQ